MCLLFSGASNAIRAAFLNTSGLIEDVYYSNQDGFGFMYAVQHKGEQSLKIVKKLPQNADHVRKMFEALPNDDRMVAGHARMRTHGDINLDNCHPYPINQDSWLMHNGILSTGNKKDTTKSDTWHFIEDFLKGARPDTLHDPAMVKLLGEFIEQNRFAIMSADGRLSVVNKDQGLEHAGVWFSNTYAWTPSLLIPSYRTPKTYGYKGWKPHSVFGAPKSSKGYVPIGHSMDGYQPIGGYAWPEQLTEEELDDAFENRVYDGDDDGEDDEAVIVELVAECEYQCDTHKLAAVFETYGTSAVTAILQNWVINTYDRFDGNNFGLTMRRTVEAWTAYEDEHLSNMLATEASRTTMAEALLFYCDMSYCGEFDIEDDDAVLSEPTGAAYVDGVRELIRLN